MTTLLSDEWHDERDELLAKIANQRVTINVERRIYKSIHGELRDVQAVLRARELRIDKLLTAITKVVAAAVPYVGTPLGTTWLRTYVAVEDQLCSLVPREAIDGNT